MINQTVIGMIQQQAKTNPNQIAVSGNNEQITYADLMTQVNNVANFITQNWDCNSEVIAIYGEKSIDYVICMLAIMASGNYYMPLSNTFPQKRLAYMLDKAACHYIIDLANADRDYLTTFNAQVTDFATLEQANISDQNIGNESHGGYVIFTSGTTGLPKGVQVSATALLNTITGVHQAIINDKKIDNIAVFAPFIFDSSYKSVYLALCYGKQLILVSADLKQNLYGLVNYLGDKKVQMCDLTPSYFTILSTVLAQATQIPQILLLGGEKITAKHQKIITDLTQKHPSLECWNVYGPTESTIDVAVNLINQPDKMETSVGKPLPNVKIKVVNSQNSSIPIGTSGEVILGGAGLAEGYINDPQTTNQAFIAVDDERYYKTGDVGFWDDFGKLNILGRKDDQIKLNGFRIKLSDIEKNINQIATIDKTTVIEIEDKLIAFVTAEKPLSMASVNKEIANMLPGYMIPSNIIELEQLPLTINGKVDTNKLKEIYLHPATKKLANKPAIKKQPKSAGSLTSTMIDVWQNILATSDVDEYTNFYQAGGDSLKAIQIVSELSKQDITIDISDIMKLQNINSIVQKYDDNTAIEEQHELPDQKPAGGYALSPMQRWILARDSQNINHRNISFTFQTSQHFDIQLIAKTISVILQNHPQLRVRFTDNQQIITAVPAISEILKDWLWYFPNSSYDETTVLAGVDSLEGSLNISAGKIFKVAVFQNDQQDIITLCAHQLVMDHFSFRILVEEFFKLLMEYSKTGTLSEQLIDNYRENYSFENWINYKQATYQPVTNDLIQPEPNNLNPFLSMDFQEDKIALSEITLPKNIESYLLWTMEQAFYQELKIENNAIILGNNGRVASLMAGKDISKTIGRFGCIAPFAISHDDSVEQIAHNIKKFNDGYGENFLWINDKNVEKHSTITFNWMGDFSKTFNMGLPIQVMNPNAFNTLDLYSRENYPFHLKVSSYINGAYLYLSFRYDTRVYSKTTMKATLDCWTKTLANQLQA